MILKTVQPADYAAIDQFVKDAFTKTDHGYDGEVDLIHAIRQDPAYQPYLEVVAHDHLQPVGMGLLSPITVSNDTTTATGLALAPLAVAPAFQNQGVGRRLIEKLEQRARISGAAFVSILGWPAYYSQFDYQPAANFDIQAPFAVDSDAYLVKAPTPDGLKTIHGTIGYLDAFGL